ncbi:MAG: prolipoprotein diacylglyceryl transferase family protein [Planctomycetota bacterium]
MHPELFTIPFINLAVKSYGFMLMLGFLSAIWIGMRLAERVKASPDILLNCGIVCLFFGVGGARLFYVIHYWQTDFAFRPNPFWAALNISAGGLEYLGGLIGAVVGVVGYMALRGRLFARNEPRLSLRLYLDILAPVAMWGLAFGRAGCFLNGCCWGGLCTDTHHQRQLPWAVTFPFSSGAHERQWMNRQVTVPAELIWDDPRYTQMSTLVPKSLLEMPPEALRDLREFKKIDAQYQAEKAKGPVGDEFGRLEARWQAAQTAARKLAAKVMPVEPAKEYPSRKDPSRQTTLSELNELAERHRSLPVHPAQLYGIVNALLLSWVLVLIFNRRRRHGVVMGWMMLLYPISRFILELVRVDNPHDVGGLTISQAFGLGLFVCGLLWMFVTYRLLPLRSPLAVPWIAPEMEKVPVKAGA